KAVVGEHLLDAVPRDAATKANLAGRESVAVVRENRLDHVGIPLRPVVLDLHVDQIRPERVCRNLLDVLLKAEAPEFRESVECGKVEGGKLKGKDDGDWLLFGLGRARRSKLVSSRVVHISDTFRTSRTTSPWIASICFCLLRQSAVGFMP